MSPLNSLRAQIAPTIKRYLRDYAAVLGLSRLDDKLIRDPIFGFQRLRCYECLIIDSPLFQRLRGIFQTSVSYLTYPSSIHTRFEHSLNCMNLAGRVVASLREDFVSITAAVEAEIRLAALLHDIGHSVFSHGSEFFYRQFQEVQTALTDEEISGSRASESECVNYSIITCRQFRELLWDPIKKRCREEEAVRDKYNFLDEVKLQHVAQMIIGLPPARLPERRFHAEIINGPTDVDKLDYLTRDGYFTGVSLNVDIDRLLPSFHVDKRRPSEEDLHLVVDHRGIGVVEQLLFARMALYDTVYHHHKVRAANAALQSIFYRHSKRPIWPTPSKRLARIADFLEVDEYDFFGSKQKDKILDKQIKSLRYRNLPKRALVVMARSLCDQKSHKKWERWGNALFKRHPVAQKEISGAIEKLTRRIVYFATKAGAKDLTQYDVFIDIPPGPRIVSGGMKMG